MKIIIGTQSPPKVEAIKQAISDCHYFSNENTKIETLKVDSGVSDMPTSIGENMLGAKNRALNCAKKSEADFYIGMEGGTSFIGEKTYLFGVIYVLDKNGNGHYGFSNMMEVPNFFQKKIYNEKLELGPVLQEISGIQNVSKKNGAFGVWSDDILTRKEQFKIAFLSAISPFFNKYYKM